jgi:hypothetical protein
VLFIIRQQVQPAFIMQLRQSQHDWIISQHLASPLVQVTTMPLSVISHLHNPSARLQQQTIMPFIIMQQLHRPPCIMLHRFCIMLHAVLSSQVQVIFIPPWQRSNFIVQRGTIIQLAGIEAVPGMPAEVIPAVPMPIMALRSIIRLDISFTPLLHGVTRCGSPHGDSRTDRAKSLL